MVVTLRKVLTNLAQLFFDDVIVVDEPFGCGCNRAAIAKCFDERLVDCFEVAAVVFESREQLGMALFGDSLVFGGESLCVLFEAFDAEELRLKGLLVFLALRFAERRYDRIKSHGCFSSRGC